MIRNVKLEDIQDLAIIYKDLYDNANIGEIWTVEKSYDLLLYWYEKQKDLFFVAEEDNKPVGAIVSGVKSWFDGLRLIDTEIFVSQEYQGKHIAKNLMLEHLKKAKIKYNVTVIEFHTYGEEEEFPQNWYNRIGLKKDDELIIMNGNVENILNRLGYFEKTNNTEEKYIFEDIKNYSYKDVSDMYSSYGVGDNVYSFDMLPPYAYQNNDSEKQFLEGLKMAMKNGANFNLFIIGSKEKLKALETNELYNDLINSCENNSKIYVINENELKEKCLDEYSQLAMGLEFCVKKDGTREAFRDLWFNIDNIGIFIKRKEILDYIENTVNNILNKIETKEIVVERIIESKNC